MCNCESRYNPWEKNKTIFVPFLVDEKCKLIKMVEDGFNIHNELT